MAGNGSNVAGSGSLPAGDLGQFFPAQPSTWPDPKTEFRKSTNEIEGKEWFEMDVSQADTIVIIHEGKRVEMDKKDFLQRIGLEW
ncbi:hypothetical protein LCGC14_0592880 [marine sediment metagenome]|uniref:Uncharacterized protein n=1 Tax=marine sediment metagenome TaxID=412755 RepID=A0A0F9RCY0_9ZZZZ